MSIFAATYHNENVVQGFLSLKTDYSRQSLYLVISIVLATFILLTDSKFFTATANLFYFLGIVLLLLVFPFHTEVKGTNSIIRFANFQLQPAELCKIFVNLALAKYLSRIDTDFTKLRSQLHCYSNGACARHDHHHAERDRSGPGLFFLFPGDVPRRITQCVLIVGFSLAVLVIATLLLEPNVLAIILTVIASLRSISCEGR